MFKILFIVPYDAIQQEVEEAIKCYRPKGISIEATNVIGVEDTKKLNIDIYDLIIARGITYATIKHMHPTKPIVEIGVTGFELIRAIGEAKNLYNPKKIAVVGWKDMIHTVKELGELCDIEIICHFVESDIDAKMVIKELKKLGVEVIVGGLMACNAADMNQLPCVFIKTVKETVEKSVIEAINTAHAIIEQQNKANLFKIIMDHSTEGIISVDPVGTITTINKMAYKILKLPYQMDIVGQSIQDIMPNSNFNEVLSSGMPEINKLVKYQGALLNASKVPLKVKGDIKGVIHLIQNVKNIQKVESEIRKVIHKKGLIAKYSFGNIIGKSESIKTTIAAAIKYSRVQSSVLLVGETGTGKELFAQGIHQESHRREGPFVAINCAALTENLLETELFGYVEGAFTGALKGGKIGLFELAHGGTVFLDEINEISLNLQAKLLRVLEEKEIRRVGDDRVIPINVRIITATNMYLSEKVDRGEFRRDLLYRLNVLNIKIPPLRERGEDIVILAQHYIDKFSEKFDKHIIQMDEQAKQAFMTYKWPGNIRELKNICERLSVLSDGEPITYEAFVAQTGCEEEMLDIIQREPLKQKRQVDVNNVLNMQRLEEETILEALEKTGQNKSEAAKMLGMSRSTLWRKLKEMEQV